MNNKKDVLVVEISGKRPGTKKQRPTEKYETKFDKVIISNDCEGYETDWKIVKVPEAYKNWYIENVKTSDGAWYAPMNRSYAIKYAREQGYKYVVQLDDNIKLLEVATLSEDNGLTKRYRATNKEGMLDEFIEMFKVVLENTNAGMVGCNLGGVSVPEKSFLKERYVYSIFAIKLDCCPDVFQGDFEDDIEYRLKFKQMGIPVVQIVPLRYGKVAQGHTNDLTGCRAEYLRVGVKRGERMSVLNGDQYKYGMTKKKKSTNKKKDYDDKIGFKHVMKPFKLGVIVYDINPIEKQMKHIFEKFAEKVPDKIILKERKAKNGK